MRSMRDTWDARRKAVVLAAVLSVACGGYLKPPADLSKVGDAAFYAQRLMEQIKAIQAVAKDGEAAGAISRNDAVTIVEATVVAGKAGQELAEALKAGMPEAGAKEQWVKIIREALSSVPAHLDENTQKLISPYLSTALTLLTFFS